MQSKKKWSTKVKVLTLLIIIVGIFYWIVGRLQVGIISCFKDRKKEISSDQAKNNKENRAG